MTETDIMRAIQVEATALGHRLWRNNTGMAAYASADGSTNMVRYGVGGKGGADLIGWTAIAVELRGPVLRAIPVFTAIETKAAKGRKMVEQIRYINAVTAAGGIAGFCTSVDQYHDLLKKSLARFDATSVP